MAKGNFEGATKSEKTAKVLHKWTDKVNERERDYLVAVYSNRELAESYQAIRDKNDLTPMHSKGKVHRELVRFPSESVYQFVMRVLTPKYGEGWLKDKKRLKKACLNEKILKPWVLYSPKKI